MIDDITLQKLKEYFKLFDKAIATESKGKIKRILDQLNLIEELFLDGYQNKKNEGIYYTNNEISRFIIKNAILLYLNSYKNINIESLDNLNELNQEIRKKLYNIFINLSIFDPACGTGVFLINAADIVYNLLLNLDAKDPVSNFKIIILKNLFGSDINEHALKLCLIKLVSWSYSNLDKDMFSTIIKIINSNLKKKNSLLESIPFKYNLVVSNPPYGNILNKEEKIKLNEENVFSKDIYCSFLQKALKWSSGIIGFLVPKSFLLRQSYTDFRNHLLNNANILKIYDIGSKLFKNATNEVQIVLYENKDGKKGDLQIYDYPNEEIVTYKNQNVDLLRICFNNKCSLSVSVKKVYAYTFDDNCPYCGSSTTKLNRIRIKPSSKIYQLIELIENVGDINYINIKKLPKMIRGEEDKGLKEVKKKLKNNIEGTCSFINAKNDFKYYHIKKNKSFNIEEIDAKKLKGENYEYYNSPKLLIKHNNIIPEAIYTESNVCFTSSIYSLLHDDVNELKYLCACLNSILNQFYCIYAINNQKGTTINLNQYMIRHLPIIKVNEQLKSEIASMVDQIIKGFDINCGKLNKNICQLLRDIDNLFFDLYSITEEDRKTIISTVKGQINYFKKLYY